MYTGESVAQADMVHSPDMAAKETTLNELGETLSYVVEHMATKDDIAALRTERKGDIATISTQIASIENKLKSIRRDLNDLAEKVGNIEGYGKEIDHALARIATIEKHLGIHKQVAVSACSAGTL